MDENNKVSQEEIEKIDKSKFEFALSNQNNGIHDEAFKTKPTTFFKDALKRFAKNKSSVVGAIIIGVLLLGSFTLPYITGHDIKTPHADLSLLTPKLFNAGTGWWDGTEYVTDVPWIGSQENEDGSIGAPKGYNIDVVVPGTLKVQDSYYVDGEPDVNAVGGYLQIICDHKVTENPENNIFFFRNYTGINFKDSDNLNMTVEMGGVDDLLGGKLCQYRVRLDYQRYAGDSAQSLILKEWSNDYSTYTIDLSKAIADAGLTSVVQSRIYFEGLPNISATDDSYFMIKTIDFTSDTTDEDELYLLSKVSMDNATYISLQTKETTPELNYDYWQSNGYKKIYHAERQNVNFRVDHYAEVLGDRINFVIGQSIFNEYIKKGWCEFPDFTNVETFKVLNEDKCPVKKIYSGFETNGVWQFYTKTTYYKYLGYDSMPRYIFGTTANGYDLLTLGMSCLKTSLLIAIISSAICLIIGLVWGSISGYFGGTVDLVMERITDIISGVPWIVMMTLIILLLGNNAVTFAIALIMTGWIGTASRTRTQFYRFKGREYVLASRTLGASDWRLIFRHILPNGLGTIVTGSVLMIPSCIFSEATISYLGLGLKGLDSFGVLLSSNQQYIGSYPMLVVFPAVVVSLLMISFNLFGNGLRDALNPTLKGGEQ